MLLQDKGIQADTAEDGQIGFDKFVSSEPGFYDAVLTDIRMPKMDGCEMSRRIRALDRSDAKTVPIVAMTADAFEESIREAQAAGINGYVTKPIVPNLLYKALVNAVKSD
jgi:CheY-like chemotaxis protein